MTGEPQARIRIEGDTITITAPMGANRTLLLGAARRAHDLARQRIAALARQDETGRLMRGRADVFELHYRLRSWDRTIEVIRGADPDPGSPGEVQYAIKTMDQLVRDVRRFAQERVPDLDTLTGRQLRKWALEQPRFSTDADYAEDEAGWTPPPPPAWMTDEGVDPPG